MHKQNDIAAVADHDRNLVPVYGRKAMQRTIPKYDLPQGELAAGRD